jgi:hypothetical protein
VQVLLLHCYDVLCWRHRSKMCLYIIELYDTPLFSAYLLIIHIFLCPVSCIMQFVPCPVRPCILPYVPPSCHVNHLSPPTLHSFFLFQCLILPKPLLNRGNRLHVSIVPLNTPKPIKSIHDKASTTAKAIQYVLTEYVTPRSADTYSVKKVNGRNRMVALLMSNATLVRRSTPADCDMATS